MKREVFSFDAVAPARERGLKYFLITSKEPFLRRRSRKGAWIEISQITIRTKIRKRRSRKGAWIEIVNGASALSAN